MRDVSMRICDEFGGQLLAKSFYRRAGGQETLTVKELSPDLLASCCIQDKRLSLLGKDLLHDLAVDVGEPEIPALELVGQLLVIDP